MDHLTTEQRRKNMKAIKSRDSEIEKLLCSALWKRGLRYRKNYSKVFGKPDIIFLRKKIAIFCDSEFWHGYDWDNKKEEIGSNKDFWIRKIERNMHRDKEVNLELLKNDWIVLRFWGKDIKRNLSECVEKIERTVSLRELK